MTKTNYIIIISYTLILIIITYLNFNSKSNYKTNLKQIELKYQKKYDSLNNNIIYYELKINDLEFINKKISSEIDSIKNNQNDNEKIQYTPFVSISPDSVTNIFAKYDINNRYNQ